MYTKVDIIKGLLDIGIKSDDTLLVHSSMKAIGDVTGGAETVLDALIEYMQQGLLIFPTHTWEQINENYNEYNPKTELSCVGVLTNLFLKRPGVIRSLHPTHSVAAIGQDAEKYTSGEEQWDTPCPRQGCWGRLYDRKAKILFLGCDLKRNTYLHSVEEWNNIPLRLDDKYQSLKIAISEDQVIDRPMYRHHNPIIGDVSQNYGKMEEPFLHNGIVKRNKIGDADCILGDAVAMADLTSSFLLRNPDLFGDNIPVPMDWYE
ncbi:MAG: aminoglycoside N(3)-acetyltransferase [Anaerocolumna sp.]|jgi:aminoglycoside 3-N-acetyltransferase|nr:aminoglycoside N(3)-acetyltransferase [Anaerocolumna sp.]